MANMSVGRVFRNVGGEWLPIGDRLPAWDHVPPRPNDPMAVWVFPAGDDDVAYRAGDVLTYAETAHQLIAPVPRSDVAWGEVIHAALLLNEAAEVHAWAATIDLWLCRRLPAEQRPALPSFE